jgi:hypothetical protein
MYFQDIGIWSYSLNARTNGDIDHDVRHLVSDTRDLLSHQFHNNHPDTVFHFKDYTIEEDLPASFLE